MFAQMLDGVPNDPNTAPWAAAAIFAVLGLIALASWLSSRSTNNTTGM